MSSFPSVPGYTIVRKVAEGGSAEIFKARRQPYNTTCALKVLHARHMDDKRLIRGFETEARLLETFDHKNIIKFHRVIPKSERPAMELELFDSDHLKRIAGKIHRDGSTIPLNEALFILLQVLEALEAEVAWPGVLSALGEAEGDVRREAGDLRGEVFFYDQELPHFNY